MTEAKHLLDQIERGLDGVTGGPWYPGHLGSDSTCQCRSILNDGQYFGAIASVHVDNGLPVGEGGNDAPPAEEAAANMRHIARCSPDAIREIAAYVRETEARATAAEATVTALEKENAELSQMATRVVADAKLTDVFGNGAKHYIVTPYLLDALRTALRDAGGGE